MLKLRPGADKIKIPGKDFTLYREYIPRKFEIVSPAEPAEYWRLI